EMNAKIWVGTKHGDAGTPAALARMFVMRNVRILFVPGGTTGIPAHTTAALGVLFAAAAGWPRRVVYVPLWHAVAPAGLQPGDAVALETAFGDAHRGFPDGPAGSSIIS